MRDNHDAEDVTLAALRAAIDEGLAELDAGLGVETTPLDLEAVARRREHRAPSTLDGGVPVIILGPIQD